LYRFWVETHHRRDFCASRSWLRLPRDIFHVVAVLSGPLPLLSGRTVLEVKGDDTGLDGECGVDDRVLGRRDHDRDGHHRGRHRRRRVGDFRFPRHRDGRHEDDSSRRRTGCTDGDRGRRGARMDRTAIFVLITALAAGCTSRPRVVVGSKNFTEQVLLGEIVGRHIERRLGFEVDRKLNLGGTLLAHEALKGGSIDLYPEYTGTALTAVLKQPTVKDAKAALARVRDGYRTWGIEWLAPLGFNNSFAMVIRADSAREQGLRTLSQAAGRSKPWNLGVGYEFTQRPDGLDGLVQTYGLRLSGPPVAMDLGLLYPALQGKRIEMAAANATDGEACIMKHRPDLVFLDIGMPNIDGLQLLRKLNTVNTWNMKVVMVSAHAHLEKEAFYNSAFDFMKKPYDMMDLKVVVNRFFHCSVNERLALQPPAGKHIKKLPVSKLQLANHNGTFTVDIDDITHFYYDNSPCQKRWIGVTINKQTGQLKRRLFAPTILDYSSNFVQINQKQIANLKYFKEIRHNRYLLLETTDGTELSFEITDSFMKELKRNIKAIYGIV